MTPSLPSIPVIDARDGGALQHAREGRIRARGLRDTCVSWLPAPARAAMPLLDRMARRWLKRSQSPYVLEIEAIAVALGFPGIWFLNGSYQWSCTALAREEAGVPWLARTLDWPFPGLGRYVEIARMPGAAGEFFSVTWPGYVGVLSGLAPGRFGASINQGPLRRRTHMRLLRPLDFALNGLGTLLWQRSIPPDQLLRFVFEEASDYHEAKRMLEVTPIARPVIFTLVGCHKGERCVIERTENDFTTRIDDFGAANDWLEPQSGWEGRISANQMLTTSYKQATAKSVARRQGLASFKGSFVRDSFSWVAPPVLNPYTRMALEMCPASGVLRVVGYERQDGALPTPATLPCEVEAERLPA
ncbi:hypothetical protein [Rhodoplanes sp. Z2-YC6860]|uniref:hypothetical protein n=1 Tax=Rhodoplanes sp. Z2-YC6860 TaxID=674703 RepID=UPI00078C258B|nr:hypothetical protein [Rhodoplanes sp. Z2-YC6860]AMN41887.1 hypothetical protein RHPLAN_34550 [Rhodoplanes sp. Z2-YC6860]